MDIIIILIAYLRWGVNSTDGINSSDIALALASWERRQRWYSLYAKEGA